MPPSFLKRDSLWVGSVGADPRFFFRRGCARLLLYFNTNKPHSFFVFFCRIPVVLETAGHLRGGGVHTSCTLPLDLPLQWVPHPPKDLKIHHCITVCLWLCLLLCLTAWKWQNHKLSCWFDFPCPTLSPTSLSTKFFKWVSLIFCYILSPWNRRKGDLCPTLSLFLCSRLCLLNHIFQWYNLRFVKLSPWSYRQTWCVRRWPAAVKWSTLEKAFLYFFTR